MTTSAFELMGLPVRWEIDLPALEKAYRDLQKKFHPDRFARADAKERVEALQKTTRINEAYRALKDPMRRAEELLRLRGIVVGDDAKMEPEFLEEILGLRESLEDAKAARDLTRVRALAADVARRRDAAVEVLAKGFGTGRPMAARLAATFARLRYFVRFFDEVAAIEADAADRAV